MDTRRQTPTSSRARGGLLSAVGAVVAAVLSSACCWIPLLLVGLGVSATRVAGVFARYRPALLVGAGVLLAAGFYSVYRRQPECSADACSVARPRLRRFNKVMLWIATPLVVIFAAFPTYVSALAGDAPKTTEATSQQLPSRTFTVAGMTCSGCASHVKASLAQIRGVRRVAVSYARKTARIWFERGNRPSDGAIVAAVKKLGYHARLQSD